MNELKIEFDSATTTQLTLKPASWTTEKTSKMEFCQCQLELSEKE